METEREIYKRRRQTQGTSSRRGDGAQTESCQPRERGQALCGLCRDGRGRSFRKSQRSESSESSNASCESVIAVAVWEDRIQLRQATQLSKPFEEDVVPRSGAADSEAGQLAERAPGSLLRWRRVSERHIRLQRSKRRGVRRDGLGKTRGVRSRTC